MKKSNSVLGMWALIGVVLGVAFGASLGSFTVGLPMGLAVSFLAAIVVDRAYSGVVRLVK